MKILSPYLAVYFLFNEFFLGKICKGKQNTSVKIYQRDKKANFEMQIEVYCKFTCITSFIRLDFHIYSIIAIILRLIQLNLSIFK